MSISFGYYGYFNDVLLKIIPSKNKWEFTTNDEHFIKHGFIKGKYSYRLEIKENQGIRAYQVSTYCKYKGGRFFFENIFDNTAILAPDDETKIKLGYHPYDDRRLEVNLPVFINDVEEIWEERKPVDGFIFDVDPVFYLKKKD